jgi:hypothetical protein
MTKFIIAVLAVSVSVLAVACGGGTEEAKAPEGAAPAGETTAPAADPAKPAEGTPPAGGEATPPPAADPAAAPKK